MGVKFIYQKCVAGVVFKHRELFILVTGTCKEKSAVFLEQKVLPEDWWD